MTPNPPSETAALYEEPWVLKAPMPVDPNPFPRFRLFRWLPLTPESVAAAIFQAALDEGRAGELLDALFDGGSATVDAVTGRLVIVGAAALTGLRLPDLS